MTAASTAATVPVRVPSFRLGQRPVLDGVRGLAVLLVVLHHTTTIAPRGYAGVDLFFVLSGFLITSLLEEEYKRHHRIAFGRFYLRRLLRLGPALGVLLLALAVWVLNFPTSYAAGPTAHALLPTFLYFSNWTGAVGVDSGMLGHTWSLGIEEQYYLVWPVLVWCALRAGGRPRALLVCAVGIAAAVLARYLFVLHGTGLNQIYNGFETRWDSLLLGSALSLLLHARSVRVLPWLALLAPVSLASLVFVAVSSGDMIVGVGGPALAAAVLIATLVTVRVPLLTRLFESRGMTAMGRISYGVYLWHYPVAVMLQHGFGLGRGWMLLAGDLVITVTLASASYRWVEAPFRRLRVRLHSDRPLAMQRQVGLAAVPRVD